MKYFQRFIIVFVLIAIVVFTYGLELRDQYVVPIVTYHEVKPEGREDNLLNVTVENFEKQMFFLKKYKYNVISLDDLVSAIMQKKALPRNSVVLTFDDGNADNYDHAFPILKKYGFPATIFVGVGAIGKKGFLTWDQIKEMEKNKITFGSHTYNHVYLPDLPQAKQRKEIFFSKKVLEHHLGHKIDHFCYPQGGFSAETKELVKKAGYVSACTTNRGYSRFNRDRFELKRIRFANRYSSSVVFWAKLSGYYNLFKKPASPH